MYISLYYLLSLLGQIFLAVLYGSLLHFALQWLIKKSWSKIYTHALVLAGLLVWQNSYWGKKSGPEYERIPLGNHLEIRKWGGEPYVAQLMDQNKKVLVRTKAFIKSDDKLFGKTAGETPETYFVLNIPSHEFTLLPAEVYYRQVEQAGFPGKEQFKSYKENWENHWGNRIIALLY